MAPFGQTIAVIDKSGKVVSTVWTPLSPCHQSLILTFGQSKQLFGVFNQAKTAYRERKSQYESERSAKIAEQQALQGLANYQIDDSPSVASRRSRGTKSRHHSSRSHHHRHRASSHYEQDLHSVASRPQSYYGIPADAVARRHTHHDITLRQPPARPTTARSRSDAHIDMDLAYGDAHPAALSRYNPGEQQQQPVSDQKQLDGLVHRAQWLLEEAHCVQHGATATISHLQKNPDAMAAVALTLAEISNLARKMAPSALTALKSAAPTVFALLSSPQFLIAAGVGLGVTVVMFGGYKIVKQIQSGNADAEKQSAGMDDMMELNVEELSSVERWRRGVADMEAVSVGTSVDGEFITPTAAAMSGIDVTTARAAKDPRFKYEDDVSVASSRRSRRSRSSRAPTRTHSKREPEAPSKAPSSFFSRSSSKAPSKAPSRAPSRAPSSRASSKTPTQVTHSEKRPKEKKKGPSRLRLMFTP
ncbi:hypothetical protein NUU61_002734 [Penicillium alfredii]|uniref:Uncharacterized protein n=1 Tax=Penicillium alfredii TaxID=1506179 RepID=A0A9W9FS83_9EURO|nr:uncharacterized protein NUU61_002734 [Penicillium alfredii]KAJ5105387.1 hypothetical protein NUU61_002734 [Penicillium alfredii]